MYRITILLFLSTIIFSCKTTKNITTVSQDAPDYYVADTDVKYLRAFADSKEDNDINDLIAPYKVELSKEMDITIGVLPMEIKKGRPNSNMGNWFCDLLLDATERVYDGPVDFALQNYGGLRIPSLSKGPISKGKIFELMPFDNKLVILTLNANQMQELCNLIAEDGGWPISRGLTMTIDRPNSVATDIKIRGKEIDSQSKYHVAITDYIANGGGGAEFLKIIPQHDTGFFIRDVLIEQLEIMMENDTEITIDDTKRIK